MTMRAQAGRLARRGILWGIALWLLALGTVVARGKGALLGAHNILPAMLASCVLVAVFMSIALGAIQPRIASRRWAFFGYLLLTVPLTGLFYTLREGPPWTWSSVIWLSTLIGGVLYAAIGVLVFYTKPRGEQTN